MAAATADADVVTLDGRPRAVLEPGEETAEATVAFPAGEVGPGVEA